MTLGFRSTIAVLAPMLFGMLVVVGCAKVIDFDGEGGATQPDRCFDCHGTPANGNSAPPRASWRALGPDAHQAHLKASDWHSAVSCETCHIVPTAVLASGHVDSKLPAELVWSGLAVADGASPDFDDDRKTCDVYCHGSTLAPGGSNIQPSWTAGSQEAACGTCHGLPPGGEHPEAPDCSICHGEVVDADGQIIAPELHIDGEVAIDGDLRACDSCHGGDGEAAPPVDTQGNSDVSAPGVGAHRVHLDDSDWHAQIACAECHVVPEMLLELGHIDTLLPAELVWGVVATGGSETEPTYDSETNVCTNVYCHDTGLPGADDPAPIWVGDETDIECGSCHGIPPGGFHEGLTACGVECHNSVVDEDVNIICPELHISGIVNGNTEACP